MGKVENVWNENIVTILRIALFAMFSLLSYKILGLVTMLFEELFPSFLGVMSELNTPLLFGSKVSLDILGFLFPLAISIVFALKAIATHTSNGNRFFRYSIIILIVVLILDTLYTMLSGNQLKPIYKNGGGPNIPALIVVPGFAGLWVAMDIRKIGPLISYIFGFLVGVVSDVESIPYLTKPTVFGGFGILDLDFAFPIIMYLSFRLALKISSKF
ncbi:hypothetical protein IX51_11420 [uncultured archaeon]|nr:hypothetical protein IX51_11420 [uncultured archaeon]